MANRLIRWLIVAVIASAIVSTAGCTLGGQKLSPQQAEDAAKQAITAFKTSQKIEPRVTPFEISAAYTDNRLRLTGVVDSKETHQAVVAAVRRAVGSLTDGIRELPDPALAPKNRGIVNVPVLNLGEAPGRDDGDYMVTQSILGNVFELLEESGGWYRVRMHDQYLGWVDGRSVVRVDSAAVQAYTAGQQAVVTAKFTPVTAVATAGAANILPEQAVQGTVLPVASTIPGWVQVKLPDGRLGWIGAASVRLTDSIATAFPKGDAQSIIATAKQYVDLHYLWGGTTSYGFDCSGLTQYCYRVNGYSLPRDADMQYAAGAEVKDRALLQPGDLVFFSTYKAGPSHVGIYIGDGRYIQSGGSTGVKICSFDPKAPDYNNDLDKKYLGARRFIK